MKEGFNSKKHYIKELLNWWIDPDVDYYAEHKRHLYSGLSINFQIRKNELALTFVGTKTKSFQGSTLPDLLRDVIFVNDFPFLNVLSLRGVYDRVHIFLDDEIKLDMVTGFGTLNFVGKLSDHLLEEEIKRVIPDKELSTSRKWTSVKITLRLIRAGTDRLKFESDRINSNPIDCLNEINNHIKKELFYWEEMIPMSTIQRRLAYFDARTFEEIDVVSINFKPKNVLLLYFISSELVRSSIWFKTNSSCIDSATKRYEYYESRCEGTLKSLKFSSINLGKISLI